MHHALLTSLFLGLAACSTVVPSTLAYLNQLDPLTADPAAIQVALILPPGLSVAPGSASLSLTASRGELQLEESFALTPSPLALQGFDMPAGASSQAFRLEGPALDRMRAVQAQIRTWEAEDPVATRGGFSVFVGGCGVGDGPATDATASILIRTAADGPFLPLVRDANLRDVIGPELFDAIAPCTTAQ